MLNKAIISFSNSTSSNDTFIVFTIYKDNINFEIWEFFQRQYGGGERESHFL